MTDVPIAVSVPEKRLPTQVVGFGLWMGVALAVATCAIAFFAKLQFLYKVSWLVLGLCAAHTAQWLCKDDPYSRLEEINKELTASLSLLQKEVGKMEANNLGLAKTNKDLREEVSKLHEGVGLFRDYLLSLESIIARTEGLPEALQENLEASHALFSRVEAHFFREQKEVSHQLAMLGQLFAALKDDRVMQDRIRELLSLQGELSHSIAELKLVKDQLEKLKQENSIEVSRLGDVRREYENERILLGQVRQDLQATAHLLHTKAQSVRMDPNLIT